MSLFLLSLLAAGPLSAQNPSCPPRPPIGATVEDPFVVSSVNGQLSVNLTMLSYLDQNGDQEYCYAYSQGVEAPLLELNPGDNLVINLKNGITAAAETMPGMEADAGQASSPCSGMGMTSSSTNIHFHGMNIPPTCHQDDVIKTAIQPGDPTFQYNIQVPQNDPPGLYWYHPHPHGFTALQVLGGAAGPLVIGGIEGLAPEAGGLPQRVFVIRQSSVLPPPPGTRRKNTNLPPTDNDNTPLSINFVPAPPKSKAPRILIKPSEKQLWRIVNATSIYFLALQVQVSAEVQPVQVVAIDGIPTPSTTTTDTVVIPPAGRAEFIMQGPPEGVVAQLVNLGFDTGPGGDLNAGSVIANIVARSDAPEPLRTVPLATKHGELRRFVDVAQQKPSAKRKLYFSEKAGADGSTLFFITVDGQKPRLYDPSEPPAIVTNQGAVEDWIIENRSPEVHAFHIHQIHFVMVAENGKPTNDPTLRDTVVVPYWNGVGQYPSVTLRMDFRDPETTGTFLYHCHILDHEDGGMMAKIQVNPAKH
jgi:FtsP/CotA-like multicopper oxidase with cupredoxin domain